MTCIGPELDQESYDRLKEYLDANRRESLARIMDEQAARDRRSAVEAATDLMHFPQAAR